MTTNIESMEMEKNSIQDEFIIEIATLHVGNG